MVWSNKEARAKLEEFRKNKAKATTTTPSKSTPKKPVSEDPGFKDTRPPVVAVAAPKVAKTASKKLSDFGKAFSTARKAGKKEFTWKGKRYNTKVK